MGNKKESKGSWSIKNCQSVRQTRETEYRKMALSKGYRLMEEYKGSSKLTNHLCLKCNEIWRTTPKRIKSGHNCMHCAIKNSSVRYKWTNDFYLDKIKNYPVEAMEEYKGTNIKIQHKCKKCQRLSLMRPSRVLKGHWCLLCELPKSIVDVYKNKRTTLYLIDIINVGMKVGVTKKTIMERYSPFTDFNIVEEISIDDGLMAWTMEQTILEDTKKWKLFDSNTEWELRCGGATEVRDYQSYDELTGLFEDIKKYFNICKGP